MGAPHNKERYGELWQQHRIDICLVELEQIKSWVTLSGGWAWHFMSPQDHVELKHAHDHKDIDLFVEPELVATVISVIKLRGFERVWTKYDKHESEEDFRRYERIVEEDSQQPVRVTIDFFVARDIPAREIDGWTIVEPEYLLGLYGNIHSSDKCFAVQAAKKLLEDGVDPVGRNELCEIPEMDRE